MRRSTFHLPASAALPFRTALLTVLIVSGAAMSARAQASNRQSRLMTIPERQLVTCAVGTLDPKSPMDSSATFVYEFEVGRDAFDDRRDITVSYAASGVVVQLTDIVASTGPTGDAVVEAAHGRFMANGAAFGLANVQKWPDKLPTSRALKSDELAKVRELAAWLWTRRCGAGT